MNRTANAAVKGLTTGLMVGGATFLATRAMTKTKGRLLKKSAGKALKAVGSMIDTLQG